MMFEHRQILTAIQLHGELVERKLLRRGLDALAFGTLSQYVYPVALLAGNCNYQSKQEIVQVVCL